MVQQFLTPPQQGRQPSQRALLVISAQPDAALRARIAGGRAPRRDYDALRDALHADVLFPRDAARSRVGRLLRRVAGQSVAMAWAAWRQRGAYDAIYTDGEGIGLPLSLLLGVGRRRPRHVMLSHYLSPRKKRMLFALGAGRAVDTLIVHSSAQRDLAIRRLGMPAERVALLPYFADERFWTPANAPAATPPYICTAGLEFRDYRTLLEAVRPLELETHIAAASPFARTNAFREQLDIPPFVHVRRYAPDELRTLYAGARFVVVPLHEVDNQAGITVILEAMAMAKAVIVTGTRGQTDVVRDPANGGRGDVAREWWPGFVDTPEVAGSLAHLPTGVYVAPGDVTSMRAAIEHLLAHPEIADEMGRNGRRVVESLFGLDQFALRFAAVIAGRQPEPALPAR